MRHLSVRALLLFVYLFCATSLFAQSADVSGTVTDQLGALVPNATIRLVNQQTLLERKTSTNARGDFAAPFVSPGTYQIIVEAPGFTTSVMRDLKVDVAAKVNLPIRLHVGKSAQTIEVNGAGIQLNTADGSVSTVIGRDVVENMLLTRGIGRLERVAPPRFTRCSGTNATTACLSGTERKKAQSGNRAKNQPPTTEK